MQISISKGDPMHPDVVAMIRESDTYYASLYPAESNHLLDIETLMHPTVHFYIATVAGRICGFGSIVELDGYGEIKRMYVSSSTRGQGIGLLLLKQLEITAFECGTTIVRLETGIKQPAAIQLYRNHGYQEIQPFGSYQKDPLSLFMQKILRKL